MTWSCANISPTLFWQFSPPIIVLLWRIPWSIGEDLHGFECCSGQEAASRNNYPPCVMFPSLLSHRCRNRNKWRKILICCISTHPAVANNMHIGRERHTAWEGCNAISHRGEKGKVAQGLPNSTVTPSPLHLWFYWCHLKWTMSPTEWIDQSFSATLAGDPCSGFWVIVTLLLFL